MGLNTLYPKYAIDSSNNVTGLVAPGNTRVLRPLLTKIRAGITAAEKGNSVDSQPWLPPINLATGVIVGWVLGTVYPTGFVVTNAAGTHLFVARVGGTSGGAQPAAMTTPLVTTTPYNMGSITDNTVTWDWLGPVRTTAAINGAPSVTVGGKNASLSTSHIFADAVDGGAGYSTKFKFNGGLPFAGVGLNVFTYIRGAMTVAASRFTRFSGNYINQSNCGATFMTDAPWFALDLTTGAQSTGYPSTHLMSVEVDDRRITDGQLGVIATAAAGSGFLLFDFRSTGVRTPRKIRLNLRSASPSNLALGRFYTSPADSVWFPTNSNRYRMCIVGDSITDGSANGPSVAGQSFAEQFGALIGCDDIVITAQGGTGFVADSSGAGLTYIGRISDITDLAPDVVYINGCYNDLATASATRIAAMLAYMQAVRSALPSAIIVMAGTQGGIQTTTIAVMEADQSTAVSQFNDPNTYFIPVSTDTPTWIGGTGYLAGTNGSGNSDIYIGPTDAVHPSNMGIAYLAKRHAIGYKALINRIS